MSNAANTTPTAHFFDSTGLTESYMVNGSVYDYDRRTSLVTDSKGEMLVSIEGDAIIAAIHKARG